MAEVAQGNVMALRIVPEPTGDERDAIVAALVVLTRRRAARTSGDAEPGPTPWRRVARSEGIQARHRDRGWRS